MSNMLKDNKWFMIIMEDDNSYMGQLFLSRGMANNYIRHYKMTNAKAVEIKITEIKKKKKRKIS